MTREGITRLLYFVAAACEVAGVLVILAQYGREHPEVGVFAIRRGG